MRRPRVRLTVRGMIFLMAVIAIALSVAREFRDGLPPRFFVDGIPRRIERLRPGMTWEQTRDILGLETSWLRGGTDARFFTCTGNGHVYYETYLVRPMRIEVVKARVRGGPPEPVKISRSPAVIQLVFSADIESAGWGNGRKDDATRLVRASFSRDSVKVAEMPRSR